MAGDGKKALGGCLLIIAFGLAFFVVIGLFIDKHPSSSSFGAAESAQTAPVAPPLDVTAGTLFRAYHRNEVAADGIYKDRSLRVTGTVEEISKDFMDQVFLSLATPNEFEMVHADLRKEEQSTAASLEKGDTVVLLCTGGGMVIGSPMVKDCSINSSTQH